MRLAAVGLGHHALSETVTGRFAVAQELLPRRFTVLRLSDPSMLKHVCSSTERNCHSVPVM